MSKCGIVAIDPNTGGVLGVMAQKHWLTHCTEERKIKVYRDENGVPKGDGRCCYYKVESVQLALQLLDGASIKDGFPVKVSRVC